MWKQVVTEDTKRKLNNQTLICILIVNALSQSSQLLKIVRSSVLNKGHTLIQVFKTQFLL